MRRRKVNRDMESERKGDEEEAERMVRQGMERRQGREMRSRMESKRKRNEERKKTKGKIG